jgi:intergrase/recombinase
VFEEIRKIDELAKEFDTDVKFLEALIGWLHSNARLLDIHGSYNDITDAADCLTRAVER